MSPRCAAPSSTSRSSAKRSPELSTQRNRLISAGSFCVALSLSNEMRTTVCRAIEHAAAASSSVGIRPGFLPPLPCSAILYGSANSKGSKGPELDRLQSRKPRHSGSMLRDENEEARQFRPFRRVRISLLWLTQVNKQQLYHGYHLAKVVGRYLIPAQR